MPIYIPFTPTWTPIILPTSWYNQKSQPNPQGYSTEKPEEKGHIAQQMQQRRKRPLKYKTNHQRQKEW